MIEFGQVSVEINLVEFRKKKWTGVTQLNSIKFRLMLTWLNLIKFWSESERLDHWTGLVVSTFDIDQLVTTFGLSRLNWSIYPSWVISTLSLSLHVLTFDLDWFISTFVLGHSTLIGNSSQLKFNWKIFRYFIFENLDLKNGYPIQNNYNVDWIKWIGMKQKVIWLRKLDFFFTPKAWLIRHE